MATSAEPKIATAKFGVFTPLVTGPQTDTRPGPLGKLGLFAPQGRKRTTSMRSVRSIAETHKRVTAKLGPLISPSDISLLERRDKDSHKARITAMLGNRDVVGALSLYESAITSRVLTKDEALDSALHGIRLLARQKNYHHVSAAIHLFNIPPALEDRLLSGIMLSLEQRRE